MAEPTPVTNTVQTGHYGMTVWNATWLTADQMTDTVVIDLSGLSYTNSLVIERIHAYASAGIQFTLEIDSTADELVYNWPLGNTFPVDIDYTWGGREGVKKQTAGATGDLVITTLDAAAADEISLVIYWRNN